MILPIYAYGQPVLRKVAIDINPDYPKLNELIDNMFETMYSSDGVGLAAPQIGLSIRLFVIDGAPMSDEDKELKLFKKVFINAHIIEQEGEPWGHKEGCLSVPGIHEEVRRQSTIRITYCDENFVEHTEVFSGMRARIIQHEYDHLDGKLIPDRLSPLRRRLLQSKLNNILKGNVDVNYKIKFVTK